MGETSKPKRKKLWITLGVVAILLLVIGSIVYLVNRPVAAPPAPAGPYVTIWDGGFCNGAGNCGYSPTGKNLTAGTMLTWTNSGRQAHTVTECTSSDPKTACPDGAGANGTTSRAFDSNAQSSVASNQQYQVTFNLEKGTYYYYCTLHTWMHGSVVVQ
jgi:plastocyanin